MANQKGAPPPALRPDDDDEVVRQAMTRQRQLRDELQHLRERNQTMENHIATIMQENKMLRQQLIDVTAKHDYHQRWNCELVTKCNDLELFVNAALQTLGDAAQNASSQLISIVAAQAQVIQRY